MSLFKQTIEEYLKEHHPDWTSATAERDGLVRIINHRLRKSIIINSISQTIHPMIIFPFNGTEYVESSLFEALAKNIYYMEQI